MDLPARQEVTGFLKCEFCQEMERVEITVIRESGNTYATPAEDVTVVFLRKHVGPHKLLMADVLGI